MNRSFAQNMRTVLGSTIASALLLSASLSYADDTEIFFGGPNIEEGVRPNVLFILDNSGSMQWRTASNNNPLAGEQSRMQILKESLTSVINNAGPINAGIMVLNPRSEYDNSRMVYPVTYIDEPLPSSVTQVASQPQILVSGDDGSQSSLGGGANITAPSLQMGYVKTTSNALNSKRSVLKLRQGFFQSQDGGINYACRMNEPNNDHRSSNSDACGNTDKANIDIRPGGDTNEDNDNPIRGTALMYFTGLNVPASAAAAPDFRAYLHLRPLNTQNTSRRPTLRVDIQDSKTPAEPQTLTPIDVGRSYISETFRPGNRWETSSIYQVDITDQVKDVLDNDGLPLGDLFLKLRATEQNREYRFCMSGSDSQDPDDGLQCGTTGGIPNAPTLVIEWTAPATIEEEYSTALRFQSVGIPRGATVQSARLDFVPAASNDTAVNNDEQLTLQVRAQLIGDAAQISAGEDVVGRSPKTSAITTWDVPEWYVESPPTHQPGPDVTNLVQEVVNLGSWCGNNAMAFVLEPDSGNSARQAFSLDGAPGLQPTLTVTYTGGEGGCLNPIIEAQVLGPKDDARQDSNGYMQLDGNSLPVTTYGLGARFTGVPIKQGATILDAQLIITPSNSDSATTTRISVQNADSAPPIQGNRYNLSSGRSYTSEAVCSLNTWIENIPFVCDQTEIRSGLQSVINRPLWQPGNDLLVRLRQTSTSGLQATAYEGNPSQAIKLRMKIAQGGLEEKGYTVRNHLNALVGAMVASGGTPIVPTYLEAARYLRGERSGLPSPRTSVCQPTHVVMLTDGQANGTSTSAQNSIDDLAGSCSVALRADGIADTTSTINDERCARKLAEFMAETDQSPLDGLDIINTHTIGFAMGALGSNTGPADFMRDLADNGEGGFYLPNNASELSKAFSDILQSVQDVDTTFVSASAPVNSFERQNNKDELYFSLFKPSETNRWPGNLKRYRFALTDSSGNDNPQIVDADNVAAVDPTSGNFKSTARSFWSATTDGNNSAAGGAASRLPAPASRKLYTYIGSEPAAPVNLTAFPINTSVVSKANLGDAAMSDDEYSDLISFIRGTDPTTGTARKAMGDPIHSSPRLATYSCTTPNAVDPSKCDVEDQVAFIGTNEGFVQAINTSNGQEVFAFMPQELLTNIHLLKNDAKTSSSTRPKPYGMDNPVTLWVNDLNGDGKILDTPGAGSPQTDEFIYAYATMGRGGRGIYALDVTNRNQPKLLWNIIGGQTPGFDRLGQTWSAPVKTRIKIGTDITDVLVFAGGYDPVWDNARTRPTTPTQGNALYVVNAKTGELIWSASPEANNPSADGHRQMLKMRYSMPASPRVIDLQQSASGQLIQDKDLLADQIFIGDLGGQVWRFFINNSGVTGAALITAGGTANDGVFASVTPSGYDGLSLTDKENTLQRLYNEPDVALLSKNGRLALAVNIGSGHRGHPLYMDTTDRFYSLRTRNLTNASFNEGTLFEADLLDVTSDLAPAATEQKLSLTGGLEKGGWFISFSSNPGEKVLTRALTAGSNSTVFFSTYQPATTNANPCEAAFGTARGYAVNLFDGSPLEIADPNNPTAEDRFSVLKIPGIPPQPELLCIGDKCFVIRGPGDIEEVELPAPGKLYWIDQTELD
ncbi:pilus assembly protein [Pseudomonas xionganensis]|uniref:Pilus assembly protein PilY n=1 Tax=Pseudomonas xionganensis TaxID=2654845 RepID=A0A6I4KSI2_9PSED|nr:PilC/PilY family type IV pilus protein [Pseudomonas xionganensis]MVW74688.1 pilus assembly protein PilY [Pseudomonas xionganensis]